MVMSRWLAGALLVITACTCFTEGRSGYVLTAPKVLRAGTTERVCVTLHDVDFDLSLRLELLAVPGEDVIYSHHRAFHDGRSHCFDIDVPLNISGDRCQLHVEGSAVDSAGEYSFEDDVIVGISHASLITFIQTDKPIYKPGQTVRFRILSIKSDLKPLLDNIESVWVKDGSGVRVNQWQNVQTQQGLASLEMPMATEPAMGTWTIEAMISGSMESQTFQVEEYVLPKFEVSINPPSYVLVNADEITAEVCAMYTYGQPVRGSVEAMVCIRQPFVRSRTRPCFAVELEINGCTEVTVDADELMLASNAWSLWKAVVHFEAKVTEEGTGIVQEGHANTTKVERNVMSINLMKYSPDYFKPRLPYHGKCVVTAPDGSPLADEVITLRAYSYQGQHSYEANFTTQEDGTFDFQLPPFDDSAHTININAFAAMYEFPYTPMRHSMHRPSTYLHIKQWYSPSQSYLAIEPIRTTSTCGSELQVNITYTTPEDTNYKFYYQVMSRGDIAWSGHKHHHFLNHGIMESELVSTADEYEEGEYDGDSEDDYWVEEEQDFGPAGPSINEPPPLEPVNIAQMHVADLHIDVPITAQMAPLAKLLIYYIREDGEIIADSQDIMVDSCLENEVTLELTEDGATRLPGEETVIRLEAAAESLCSVGVVDRSVQALAGSNQMTIAQVFSMLEQFQLTESSGPSVRDTYCDEQLAQSNGEDDYPDLVGPPGARQPIPQRARRSIFPGGRSFSRFYDSSKAFKVAGYVTLTDMTLDTRPCTIPPPVMFAQIAREGRPGVAAGPVPVVTDSISNNVLDTEDSSAPQNVVDLRNYFPETWLWDLHHIDSSGEVSLHLDVPHTITTWMGSAFCTNEEVGLGISSMASVRVFQPFFASFNLPYSVVRGERVPISVTVFNYLQECLVISLTLSEENWFELTSGESEVKLCVCGDESQTHMFSVTPSGIGEHNVTVAAVSLDEMGVCGNDLTLSTQTGVRDAVTRPLLVEAEGIEEEYSFGAFVCPEGGEENVQQMALTLPDNLVEDSARAYFSVIGDVMGPALSGLDKLLKLPTGCGEQNMLKFAPNIFILQYLEGTEQSSSNIQQKALEYLQIGYQRELQYKRSDNSYSAFGDSDEAGSTWLTAFVVKSFAQARQFIFIDDNEVEQSMNWFKEKQLENGCFPSIGRILHKSMKGGLADGGSPATLTAYVLAAMLEAGEEDTTEDHSIEMALQCLRAQTVSDAYTLSLMAYAFALYDANGADYVSTLDQLNEMAITEGGMKYWTARTSSSSCSGSSSDCHHQAAAADVEMTAYALMAHIMPGGQTAVTAGLPIVRWLTGQRNGNGGFSSTQDTVVGLQALAKYATLVFGGEVNVDVSVQGAGVSDVFSIDSDNRLVLYQVPVTVPNSLTVTTSGDGCAFVQSTVRYNVHNTSGETGPAFHLRVTTSRDPSEHCAKRVINICTRYLGDDEGSNMAVVAIKMVSGWIPHKESLKELIDDVELELKRYEVDQNMVQLYFDELTETYKCMSLTVVQDIEVSNVKPGYVHVYDYYEKELFDQVPYEIRQICGTKEELPHLTIEDYENANNAFDPSMLEQRRRPANLPDINSPVYEDLMAVSCPECLQDVPEDIFERFCESQRAYKVEKRQSRNFPLKVLADIRPATGKITIKRFSRHTLDESCICTSITEYDRTKLLVLMKEDELESIPSDGSERAVLPLTADATVIPLTDRSIERQLRRHTCS